VTRPPLELRLTYTTRKDNLAKEKIENALKKIVIVFKKN
jgi:hypothetical protein